jgi:hypothetical protein
MAPETPYVAVWRYGPHRHILPPFTPIFSLKNQTAKWGCLERHLAVWRSGWISVNWGFIL